jgi:hypothetical protein
MSNQNIDSWTYAEQDVWSAWSAVEQDVTQLESPSNCTRVLETVEALTRDVARLQSAMLRGACEQVAANPFVPPLTRAVFARTCSQLTSLSDVQQHLLVGWFGMARHASDSLRR